MMGWVNQLILEVSEQGLKRGLEWVSTMSLEQNFKRELVIGYQTP